MRRGVLKDGVTERGVQGHGGRGRVMRGEGEGRIRHVEAGEESGMEGAGETRENLRAMETGRGAAVMWSRCRCCGSRAGQRQRRSKGGGDGSMAAAAARTTAAE